MLEQGTQTRTQRLIVVERSRLTTVLRIVSASMYALIVILAFSVIIARQHTIDTLRTQIDTDQELVECRSLFAASIAERQQLADNALNELVVLITRQVLAVTPPERPQFEAAIDRLQSADEAADAAIQERMDWIDAGSPLPCPVEGRT